MERFLTKNTMKLQKLGALDTQTVYVPVQGNARAKKMGMCGQGRWGEGMGDFWDSIGNVIEENM